MIWLWGDKVSKHIPCCVSYYFDRLLWLSADRSRFSAFTFIVLTGSKMLKMMSRLDRVWVALFALAACAF